MGNFCSFCPNENRQPERRHYDPILNKPIDEKSPSTLVNIEVSAVEVRIPAVSLHPHIPPSNHPLPTPTAPIAAPNAQVRDKIELHFNSTVH